jgi:inositol-phosphate phosphatase/L-galactose 1-phosphate phosphatase
VKIQNTVRQPDDNIMSVVSSPYQAELELAKSAARKAGEIIRTYSTNNSGRTNNSAIVNVKSGVDLVTEADIHVERVIMSMINDAFPNDIIIGEEDQAMQSSNSSSRSTEEQQQSNTPPQYDAFPANTRIWCIDPIDGTTNFVHNYPFVAVSIGFIDNGVPCVGVVYNPFTDCLYEAAKGSGTLLNGQQCQIDTVATSIQDCLLVNNIGHCRDVDFINESTHRVNNWLTAGLRGYRSSGSAAQNLAHVASGQVSCYYEHGYGGPWDVCAGIVLVQEAGGVVWDASIPVKECEEGGGMDLRMHFGKGSVCAGGRKVVKDVLRVAGTPTVNFSLC